jgi:hypothetical protein
MAMRVIDGLRDPDSARRVEQANRFDLILHGLVMFERQINEHALDRVNASRPTRRDHRRAISSACGSAANASAEPRKTLRDNWSSRTISAKAPFGVKAQ